VFIGFYGGIREPRVYLYHFPPECAGPPCSAAPTYAVSLDRSTFFYFNIVPLISTGKMSTHAPVIFTKMVSRKKLQQKEEIPSEEQIQQNVQKRWLLRREKTPPPQKARKNYGVTEVANTAEKRNCLSYRAYPVGRVRIWITSTTASANRSSAHSKMSTSTPRIEPVIPRQHAPS
jgi:hypothetical protein